ncbi:vWA domain-containing protein [Arthrobacter mobilis]|uniref:VWA domain-containing protein n=1 Tax=Arthrobacter mobilis TaxID=2724944 RepID=A0A7X6K504_9MICC|nr:vWA domain-containing protein [Arthrobacter mobilis]NKX55942.1 VWA domain-containing protein [Arthrobacter mobilis]
MASQFRYEVDIVLVIDATGSMHHLLDEVKANALRFHDDLQAEMFAKDKEIDKLRVRVIAFRDFWYDEEPLVESDFFVMPDEAEAYSRFVQGIVASGGGDEPESGLEALAAAINSPWATGGSKRRQVIVLWTDASAHALERAQTGSPPAYPAGLPKDFDELTDLWMGQGPMSAPARRLLMYAPDATPWSSIGSYWDQNVHYMSRAGEGLQEVDYKAVLDAISQSV